MIAFEFDEAKSQANLLKHDISFVDAQALWNDPRLLEIPAKTEDEPRYLMIGLITADQCLPLSLTGVQISGLFPFVAHVPRR
ncbi:BrnT family toxin [uncultured Nitrosomonas sp.]|uniref:BrnT family toxin n=1 Tax=uncultured Nitrosomonas sp. TaxID=156424 RepID=UPI00345D836F